MKRELKRCFARGFMLVVMGLLMGAPKANAQAVTSAWSSAVSGTWNDGTKWDKGVPLAGTNALLGASGSGYTVDYTNPVNYKIGALIITNTTGNTTTLNINTNGFNFTGGKIYKATININPGGVVTNTGAFDAVATDITTSKVVVNGGRFVNQNNLSYAVFNLMINSGEVLATGGWFFPYLDMTGGVVVLSGGVISSPNGALISGGIVSNVSSSVLFPRSGTIVITNVAKVVTTGFTSESGSSYGTVRFDGGTTEITGSTFATGNNSMGSGTRSASIIQSDGMVSMTNTAGLVIGNNIAAGQNAGSQYSYTIYGGTLNLERLTIGKSAVLSPVNLLFLMSGGTLNLGSGGIVTNTSSAVLNVIRLSGGMIGAQADWSSSANMVLTNTPGTGMVTFRAAHTNGVAHDIALSGVLSGNGRLTKTGAGALLLDGMNTYTGLTTVAEGTLGGTGSIAGTTTVATNAFVSGGSTTAVGTLSVTSLVLQEGAGLAWNYGTATQDRVAVTSALTLPAYCVVNVSAVEGATLSQLPVSAVLMTYTSSSGAASLDGWVVNGLPIAARVRLDAPNKRVLLITNRGTMISIM